MEHTCHVENKHVVMFGGRVVQIEIISLHWMLITAMIISSLHETAMSPPPSPQSYHLLAERVKVFCARTNGKSDESTSSTYSQENLIPHETVTSN